MNACLACGAQNALETVGSPHQLGALLCVAHLVAALEADKAPLSSTGSQERVPRDHCWAQAITCPRPATVRTVNAGWCAEHAPPAHVVPPVPPAPRGPGAEDGMASAVLAVLEGLGGTILHTRPGYYGPLDPLEGP